VLPVGSGATIFYSYGDLRLSNPTDQPIQLGVRVGRTQLHGVITTDRPWPLAYHVEEVGHRFVREADELVYRENELWQRVVDRRSGAAVERTLIARNHSRVGYPVAEALIEAVPQVAAGASLGVDGRV
jgi:vancomycin resistance protein VanW